MTLSALVRVAAFLIRVATDSFQTASVEILNLPLSKIRPFEFHLRFKKLMDFCYTSLFDALLKYE